VTPVRETGGVSLGAVVQQESAYMPPRCAHTRLTMPECHCPQCLALMMASRSAPAPDAG
jgi:hypothetical protein